MTHAVNWPRLAADLDAARRDRGMSLRAIAAETGLSASGLTKLRHGDYLCADGVAALAAWLYPQRTPHWITTTAADVPR